MKNFIFKLVILGIFFQLLCSCKLNYIKVNISNHNTTSSFSVPTSAEISTLNAYSRDIKIVVRGVEKNDFVEVFLDNTCLHSTGSTTSNENVANINIYGLDYNTNSFYFKRSQNNLTSDCSSVLATYKVPTLLTQISLFSNINKMTGIPSSFNLQFMQSDSLGRTYLVSNSSNYQFIFTDDFTEFHWKSTPNGLPVNFIPKFFQIINDVIYLGTNNGLFVSYNRGESFFVKTTTSGLADYSTEKMVVLSNGNIVILGANKLSLSTNNGQSFTEITTQFSHIIQDILSNENMLLVATNNGLYVSLDSGQSFNYKNATNGLTSNNITTLKFDSVKNTIYAVVDTISGNLIFESIDYGNTFMDKTPPGYGVPGISILDFKVFPSGGIFLDYISNGNFLEYQVFSINNGDTYSNIIAMPGVQATATNVYSLSTANELFLIASDAVYKFNKDGSMNYYTGPVNDYAMDSPSNVAIDQNGSFVLYSTQIGFSKLNSNNAKFVSINVNNVLNADIVNKISNDNNSNMYLATNNGVYITSDAGNNFSQLSTLNGIAARHVNDVYKDNIHNILMVSTANGLSYSQDNGSTFTNRTQSNGLWNNNIYSSRITASGNFVVAHMGGGIGYSINDGLNFTLRYSENSGIASPWTKEVLVAADNTVYAASTYWNTTYVGGLSISLDEGFTYTTKTITNGLAGNQVVRLREKADGKLFISTTTGFSITTNKGSSFTNYTTANGLISNNIKGTFADENGNWFILTDLGMSVSNNNGSSFTNYSLNDLRVSSLNDILIDSSKNIFLATDNGLFRYNGPKN
jgi:ligand-binding sensor domain-containing protein